MSPAAPKPKAASVATRTRTSGGTAALERGKPTRPVMKTLKRQACTTSVLDAESA